MSERSGHAIELRLDKDGITAWFNCHESSLAPCRQVCANECPVWDTECMRSHPRKMVAYCNPLVFIENQGDWFESYIGKETQPRSGAIVFEWQTDEWYGWRYADEQ